MAKHQGRMAPTLPLREHLEAEIERLIALCDMLDGDPDIEPDVDDEPDSDDEPTLGWVMTQSGGPGPCGATEDFEDDGCPEWRPDGRQPRRRSQWPSDAAHHVAGAQVLAFNSGRKG